MVKEKVAKERVLRLRAKQLEANRVQDGHLVRMIAEKLLELFGFAVHVTFVMDGTFVRL